MLLLSDTSVKNIKCSSDKTPTQIRSLSLSPRQFHVRLPKRSTASDRQQAKFAQIADSTQEMKKGTKCADQKETEKQIRERD